MKHKYSWPLIAGAIFLAIAAPAPSAEQAPTPRRDKTLLDAQQPEPGFKSLFNGRDLSGWDGNPKLWSVKDGAITGQTTAENPAKGNTFLVWTNGKVSDFELRCQFKLTPGDDKKFANSGIQYRSQVLDPANWVVGGYQADMEAGPTYTGILYEERMSRQIMAARGEKVVWDKDSNKKVVGSLGSADELGALIHQGQWNDYIIIAKGNHLQHFINGKQMVDVVDDCESKRATNGVLALQLHAGSPMMAQFKNIRIKTLSSQDQAESDDLKKIQGVWEPTSAQADGAQIPSVDLSGVVVTITDHDYSIDLGDRTDEGDLTLDSSKQPRQMDVHARSGPDEGQTLLAIYELSEDTWRVCYARAGKPRPDSFTSSEGSQHVLISYKRKKI